MQHTLPRRDDDGGWCTVVKFFRMQQITSDIRTFGMLQLADTGPREAYGKQLKNHYNHTNKQSQTSTAQVCM